MASEAGNIESPFVDVALRQLQREAFVAESNRRPPQEQAEFMMAYACYVLWLVALGASQSQDSAEVRSIVGAIHEAFGRCEWYRAGLFERILDAIQDALPRMEPGPNTGVLIPLVHVIEAANRAGCHLQHTTELTVMIDSALIMKELPLIAAAVPKS
jgi:hypothetical protein